MEYPEIRLKYFDEAVSEGTITSDLNADVYCDSSEDICVGGSTRSFDMVARSHVFGQEWRYAFLQA